MKQEPYRIKLSKWYAHPHATYWDIQKWNGKYYSSVRSGLVSLFGERAAIRAAKRALRKHEKFVYADKYFDLYGNLIEEISEEQKAPPYEGTAYCVKCKVARDFIGTIKTSDSGRQMAQGNCPVCGTKVNRVLGKAEK